MTLRDRPPVVSVARAFYQRATEEVARDLLGKLLVVRSEDGSVTVRVTEVEAYLGPSDAACHTRGGLRTARNRTMWGPAGHAYVYLVYGLHHCLNVVTVGEGRGEAVLLRGARVEEGLELVRRRRGGSVPKRRLCDGPGKLCQALGVTRALDGADLCTADAQLAFLDDGVAAPALEVATLPRVGVDYAGEAASWQLRFLWRRPDSAPRVTGGTDPRSPEGRR